MCTAFRFACSLWAASHRIAIAQGQSPTTFSTQKTLHQRLVLPFPFVVLFLFSSAAIAIETGDGSGGGSSGSRSRIGHSMSPFFQSSTTERTARAEERRPCRAVMSSTFRFAATRLPQLRCCVCWNSAAVLVERNLIRLYGGSWGDCCGAAPHAFSPSPTIPAGSLLLFHSQQQLLNATSRVWPQSGGEERRE